MRERRNLAVWAAFGVVVASVMLFATASGARPSTLRGHSSLLTDEWRLVFVEQFSGGVLNRDRWTTCYWWGVDGCNIGTNGELEWYQPGNVSVADGVLVLRGEQDAVVADDGRRFAYTSGMVSTGRSTSDLEQVPRFSFTYGRAEIRARVPAGRGLWPAFWLLPVSHESRPEIDVLEILGHDTSTLRMHYHYSVEGERRSLGSNLATYDLSGGWHTYAIEWTPDALVWYLDDVERWRIDESEIVPHEPMYLILNLAIGGDWPGAPDATTTFPAEFLVDWVRVWQHPPQ